MQRTGCVCYVVCQAKPRRHQALAPSDNLADSDTVRRLRYATTRAVLQPPGSGLSERSILHNPVSRSNFLHSTLRYEVLLRFDTQCSGSLILCRPPATPTVPACAVSTIALTIPIILIGSRIRSPAQTAVILVHEHDRIAMRTVRLLFWPSQMSPPVERTLTACKPYCRVVHDAVGNVP